MLGSIQAELKLIIAGNHGISLDKGFYLSQGGTESDDLEALDSTKDTLAKENQVTYLNEGTHTFTLNSGASFQI